MILDRYFARRFAKVFGAIFAIFVVILTFLGLADNLRRYGSDAGSFRDILDLALLDAPNGVYQILPLIVIIASISMFLGLARSSELVVTRAAGRSGLRLLVAPLVVAVLIGAIGVALLNPVVAATSRAFESKVASLDGGGSVLSLSSSGLWLRQGDADGQTVIHAARTNLSGTTLWDATFLTFDPDGMPQSRIEANIAVLNDGKWTLNGVKSWPLDTEATPEAEATQMTSTTISSSLTADQIRNNFGTPSSISIWDLPAFIKRLQSAGFSAQRHIVWFQMELSQPLFLGAMMLIGAAFTMRPQRGGKVGLNVMSAIMLAFTIYFIRNFAQILGENGDVPAALAAWAPPLAAAGVALGILLQREDG
ncbi:LPS export ABC transporter permease LptG [Loktanella sp. R86503]|uniref:LPS export ABC transporter permease LptG n=1 Tax=Loktanella sp. R86503 TaxID=3093847 RepID=UPI0036DDC742